MRTEHIYIHFPFCISKCPYCDFFSVPLNDKNIHRKYIDALLKEIDIYRPYIADKIRTVYIGGGTPSLISLPDINRILSCFNTDHDSEITIEVNPATADPDKLKFFFDSGINRLSIGSQSFNNTELRTLGRAHSAEETFYTFGAARAAGFKNINLDLIIGIPGQTAASVIHNAYEVANLSPEHVSSYILTFYDETPYTEKLKKGILNKIEDDIEIDFFDLNSEILGKYGLKRYEISNFSKEGYASKHNMNTWNFGNYLGLGASAHSFINRSRLQNPASLEEYFHSVENMIDLLKISKKVEINSLKSEFVMLGLRKTEGMNMVFYKEYFKSDVMNDFGKNMDYYLKNKILLINDNHLRIRPDMLNIFNSIVSEIIF